MLLCNTILFGLAFACASFAAEQGTRTYTNTERFLFDTDGNQVDAYSAKINYFNGTYYLYGLSYATLETTAVKAYSSNDLTIWKYEGEVFGDIGNATTPCSEGCGRPHIVYNPLTSKYVFYGNGGSSGYVVATSAFPVSGYTFLDTPAAIDPAFTSLHPADFAVETFGDQAYIAFSALNFRDPRAGSIYPVIFQTMHISPLTDEFTNTTLTSYNVTSADFDLIDQQTESPDIFQRNGVFYVVASNSCGFCNGTIGLAYRSANISGPWTRQIISAYSCEGQVEGVLPLTDPATNQTSYIWHSTSVPGGSRVGWAGHIFQPLEFNDDGSIQDLNCSKEASFPVKFTKGTAAPPPLTDAALAATDSSPTNVEYHPVCDSNAFYSLIQLWTSSKSGILKQVSVNIAGGMQSTFLNMTIFRFSSVEELISPSYRYEVLGEAATGNGSSINLVFDAFSAYPNVTVAAGDKLGLIIQEVNPVMQAYSFGNFVPYCHLEYHTSPKNSSGVGMMTDEVLLVQGSGQNSMRGLDGKTGPVYERGGKGVRFFAVVE